MTYTKTAWTNAGGPPLSATNLNKIEQGISIAQDGVVNVKEFGAVGDGVTNDRNAIQNAINYVRDNMPDGKVEAIGNFKLNSGITIYTNKVSLVGPATLDFSGMTSGTAVTLGSSVVDQNKTPINNLRHSMEGIAVEGGNVAGVVGVFVGDNVANTSMAFATMAYSAVENFVSCLKFGTNSFCHLFLHCSFRSPTGRAIESLFGLTNSGERQTFISCMIWNGFHGAHIEAGNFHFIACSFDYLVRSVLCYDRVTLQNCHIESDQTADSWLQISTNNALLRLNQCEIYAMANLSVNPMMYCDGTTARGGIEVRNSMFYFNVDPGITTVIGGSGRRVMSGNIQNDLGGAAINVNTDSLSGELTRTTTGGAFANAAWTKITGLDLVSGHTSLVDDASDRIVIQQTGPYQVTAYLRWTDSTGGTTRGAALSVDSTRAREMFVQKDSTGRATLAWTETRTLARNSILELYGFQDSGGTLNVSGASIAVKAL